MTTTKTTTKTKIDDIIDIYTDLLCASSAANAIDDDPTASAPIASRTRSRSRSGVHAMPNMRVKNVETLKYVIIMSCDHIKSINKEPLRKRILVTALFDIVLSNTHLFHRIFKIDGRIIILKKTILNKLDEISFDWGRALMYKAALLADPHF